MNPATPHAEAPDTPTTRLNYETSDFDLVCSVAFADRCSSRRIWCACYTACRDTGKACDVGYSCTLSAGAWAWNYADRAVLCIAQAQFVTNCGLCHVGRNIAFQW